MNKRFLQLGIAFIATVFLALGGLGSAHFMKTQATHPQPGSVSDPICLVSEVTISGTQLCARWSNPTFNGRTNGKIQPLGQDWSCNSNDLQLFWDANYGGAELCFADVGHTENMTNYCEDWTCWQSWNDQISSFRSMNVSMYGHFYWDINLQGASYTFCCGEFVAFVGRQWNDQISSLLITYS